MKADGKRIVYLITGMVTLLFAGIIYAWSLLKSPFVSEFGWTADQLAFNYTLTMWMFCIGGLISGLLSKKISGKVRLVIAGIMVFIGLFLVSCLESDGLFLLYIAYGFLTGLGIGIVYNVVISTVSAWFPDKKGLCSGALMMAFGFSTLLLGKVAVKLFENQNIGWRNTFIIYAAVTGAVIVIAAFVLKAKAPSGKAASVSENDFSATEMIRTVPFWLTFIFFVLFAAVGSVAISAAKDVFLETGASEDLAVTCAAFISIFNGLGRICSGLIFDIGGLRKTQFVTSGVVIAATVLTAVGLFTGITAVGIIGVFLCGFSYGFSPTVSAAMVNAHYGQSHYAINLSIINLDLIPAALMATLAGSLYKSSGSYRSTFIILSVCSVVGLVINFFIRAPKKKQN